MKEGENYPPVATGGGKAEDSSSGKKVNDASIVAGLRQKQRLEHTSITCGLVC